MVSFTEMMDDLAKESHKFRPLKPQYNLPRFLVEELHRRGALRKFLERNFCIVSQETYNMIRELGY